MWRDLWNFSLTLNGPWCLEKRIRRGAPFEIGEGTLMTDLEERRYKGYNQQKKEGS